MNIFALSKDVDKCAEWYVNSHVNKMISENCQMMSTTLHVYPNRVKGVGNAWKKTHVNHPCTVWARQSLSNWLWLRDLSEALESEWRYRHQHPRDKKHKSWETIKRLPKPDIKDVGLTKFALAMPDDCKTDDPITSYRLFYARYKNHLFEWKRRSPPDWLLSQLSKDGIVLNFICEFN